MTYRPIVDPPKRKKLSMEVKLAATIWAWMRSGGVGKFLTPSFEHLKALTAKEFCSLFEFDHQTELALGGRDDWTNLRPLYRGDHKEKTKARAPTLAKARRQRKKEESHRDRMTWSEGATDTMSPTARPKRKIQSRGFDKHRRPMRKK